MIGPKSFEIVTLFDDGNAHLSKRERACPSVGSNSARREVCEKVVNGERNVHGKLRIRWILGMPASRL
jgi:hypothetical protein